MHVVRLVEREQEWADASRTAGEIRFRLRSASCGGQVAIPPYGFTSVLHPPAETPNIPAKHKRPREPYAHEVR
jgi:hypothetical protein